MLRKKKVSVARSPNNTWIRGVSRASQHLTHCTTTPMLYVYAFNFKHKNIIKTHMYNCEYNYRKLSKTNPSISKHSQSCERNPYTDKIW